MAKTVKFGPWTIEADVQATQRFYESLTQGGADECTCAWCKNFVLVRDQAYPAEVLAFFSEVGIDHRKEGEAYHTHRDASGLHHYGGWLFCIGVITNDPEGLFNVTATFDAQLLADHGVRPGHPTGDLPCVAFEFYARLPWLAEEPAPE